MEFTSFSHAQSVLLWSTFVIALIMGALVNKTNFCTMGAVSDWVNMGDTGRIRSWLFAIAVAMLGVAILEHGGLVRLGASFPPYRSNQLIWSENLLGGLMFGAGMTLASGCASKNLVRLGGGSLKSLTVLIIIGIIAYYMVNPFPGSDKTLYSVLFYGWMHPLAANLHTSQDLGAIVAGSGIKSTLITKLRSSGSTTPKGRCRPGRRRRSVRSRRRTTHRAFRRNRDICARNENADAPPGRVGNCARRQPGRGHGRNNCPTPATG